MCGASEPTPWAFGATSTWLGGIGVKAAGQAALGTFHTPWYPFLQQLWSIRNERHFLDHCRDQLFAAGAWPQYAQLGWAAELWCYF